MEVIDIVILVFAGLMVILGFRKGLIISLATLVALILGIYLAVYFSHVAGELLRSVFDSSSTYLPVISFAVTFLAVLIGVLLLGKLIEKLVDVIGMGFLNHLAGAVLGLVKSVLILSVVFFLISIADSNQKLITSNVKQKSLFYKHIALVFPAIMQWTGTEALFTPPPPSPSSASCRAG
ncbi:MAG: CvpA family protein [Bacteroidetes bacterium]|nr:MAG: CvpA family protein [Bacteroidota bacterium]